MARILKDCIYIGIILTVIFEIVLCQFTPYGSFRRQSYNHFNNPQEIFSPFDAWRKSFSSSPNSEIWPNYYGFDPDSREFESGSVAAEDRTDRPTENNDSDEFFDSFNMKPFMDLFRNKHWMFPFNGLRRNHFWWEGPNVCIEREETIEDLKTGSKHEITSDENDFVQGTSSIFHGTQFSFNSCEERYHKRICEEIIGSNGKKKIIKKTYQCCHGFGRLQSSKSGFAVCEKIDLKPLLEVAEETGAKEFINDIKAKGLEDHLDSNMTLFLPTESSLTEFSEHIIENNLVALPSQQKNGLESSGITTKNLLLNHMVDGWVDIHDLRNEDILTTNYENSTIRINMYPHPPDYQPKDLPFRYTANCIPIVKANQLASNGIVHSISNVIQPISKNIMQIIRDRNDMTILRTVLEKTKISEILENGEKPYTLLAPTDKAFEKLEMNFRRLLKEGKGCAANILKNHILELTLCSVAVFPEVKTKAYNLLGLPVELEKSDTDDEQIKKTEIADLIGVQDIKINNLAKILESDIMATNGVVHVVDTIMLTDTALPITSLMEKKNLTLFKKLIEASGLEKELDTIQNVTFFVPGDKSLENNEWIKKLEENPSALKGNSDLIKFLKHHIAEPKIKTCDLQEGNIKTISGDNLKVGLYSTSPIHTISKISNIATINCARLIHFDDESCGSVLHQIDKPLDTSSLTLYEHLKNNENYSKFLKIVENANLTELLKDNEQRLTLFVPNNNIFEELQESFLNLNEDQLEHFVKSHIIKGEICCAGFVRSPFFSSTVQTLHNNRLYINRDNRPTIQNSGITKCDILATNGVIQEINDVINVKRYRPLSSLFF